MFEKELIEALEDVGRYRSPSPWRELAIPWRVAIYAAIRPGLWRYMRAVMARWSGDFGGRYGQVMLEALAYVCLFGLAACIIAFLILVF